MIISHAMMGTVQQARDVHLMLFYCWYIVYDVGPTLVLRGYIMWLNSVKSNIFIVWCISKSNVCCTW